MNLPALRLWPRTAATVLRTYGLRGVLLRTQHELRKRLGRYPAAPRIEFGGSAERHESTFAIDREMLRNVLERGAAVGRAARVVDGEYEAFGWDWRRLPETPSEWHRDPVAGREYPAGSPWWQIPHGLSDSDVKDVWEPGRMAWTYDLIRAYVVTGDSQYPDAFVRHFGVWVEGNAAFRGVHWSCGQEVSIRALALLWAEANLDLASRHPAAATLVRETLIRSGERVATSLGYGVSQRNNHGISEASALILLGMRFRDEVGAASGWLARGRRTLERLLLDQFADDGWYIQHSFNYMRVALDWVTVVQRALVANGDSLSRGALTRVGQAARLLSLVIDPGSGAVPNHGANDGARVLPLSLAGYGDFRPTLTAVCAQYGCELPADVRPDAEIPAWLAGPPPRTGAPLADGVFAGGSGWAVGVVGKQRAFFRAGRYRSRPGHSDPLHLDVATGGQSLIGDSGTYSYKASRSWNGAPASAALHNGPIVDGQMPGEQGPGFLWWIWPEAELTRADWDGERVLLQGTIPGVVRRTVVVTREQVVVTDEPLRVGHRSVTALWTLPPGATVQWDVAGGTAEVSEASEDGPEGWVFPTYEKRVRGRYIVTRLDDGADTVSVTFRTPTESDDRTG